MLTKDKLNSYKTLAAEWDLRWQRNPVSASVDAMAAAGVTLDLIAEVERLHADNANQCKLINLLSGRSADG